MLKKPISAARAFLDQYDLRKEAALAGVVLVGALAFAAPTRAGIPVIDASNLAQALITASNMVTQVRQSLEQINLLQSQIQQMRQEYESITGARGMGAVARTGPIEGELVEWLPGNYDALLAAYRNGLGVDGALGGRLDAIRATYQPLQATEFMLSEDRRAEVNAYTQAVGNTQLNQAAAGKAFTDINAMAARLQALGNEIDNTPDLKASLDLLNRQVYENNLLAVYAMRMQTLDMGQRAAMDQHSITRADQAQRANQRALIDLNSGSYRTGLF